MISPAAAAPPPISPPTPPLIPPEPDQATTAVEPARRLYHCSFCGKENRKVRRLIAGPNGVYICNECIALCNQIIAEVEQAEKDKGAAQWHATWRAASRGVPRRRCWAHPRLQASIAEVDSFLQVR
jgi:hypothetical protein